MQESLDVRSQKKKRVVGMGEGSVRYPRKGQISGSYLGQFDKKY